MKERIKRTIIKSLPTFFGCLLGVLLGLLFAQRTTIECMKVNELKKINSNLQSVMERIDK